jgi:hypothetical protein
MDNCLVTNSVAPDDAATDRNGDRSGRRATRIIHRGFGHHQKRSSV